jgi:hypothetical protein
MPKTAVSRGVARLATTAAAGVLAAAMLPIAPASAAPTAGLRCESLGVSRIACDALPAGGTAPYSFRWNILPNATSSGISFGCFTGSRPTVTVTVTDSVGAVATATDHPLCVGGPPR